MGKKQMKQIGRGKGAGVDEVIFSIVCAAESQKKQKPKSRGDDGDDAKGDGQQKIAKKGEKLKEEMDALVDEIDEVLEENAEEFVKNYVQRGGE
jgi:ubiquitin-like protein Pup